MRTATAGQLARLRATECVYALRVRLWDASGSAREWTNYLGTDWVGDLEITREIESPAARLALTLMGGEPTRLASPLVTASTVNAAGRAINPGRRVTVEVQTLAPGAPLVGTDWVTLFDGVADELDVAPGRIAVQARDAFGAILDATFDAEQTFASNDVANVLRAMLNAIFGAAVVPLVVPVDPAWTAPAVTVTAGTTLADAMLGVVRQLGWRLEYRWNGNTPELQLLEPNRAPTTADWSLSADDVLGVREVRLDRLRLRNAITVVWRDPSSQVRQFWTSEDAASIAQNGRRPLVIRESATSEIRTQPQAQRMAAAILADLKDLGLAYQLETRALWPIEVGDVLDVGGIPAVSDSTQRLAVQRHTLRIAGGSRPSVRSTLVLRGRPASQSDSWFRIGDGQGVGEAGETTASASFTSAGAVRINVIGPVEASAVRAAVSIVGPPSGADVDAATGGLASATSMAALTSPTTYAVGDTVYVAAAAYVGGVRGRVIQLVIQRDAAAGTVAVGPDLEVRLALSDTQGTITYLASGTIEISEDGGAFSTAPASPFTRPRAAAGSNTVRTVTMRATDAGQTMSNTVVIPPLATIDTDTVAPDLRLIRATSGFGSLDDFVAYTVQGTNPKAGGPAPALVGTWAGTTVERFDGSGWVAMTSGAALVTGDLLRMTRPLNGAAPGSFTARATITGGGAEEITITVPQRAVVLPPAVVAQITASTATQIEVTVTTVPGGGTVRLVSATANRASGPLPGVDVPSGSVWIFDRTPINTGSREALFSGTLNGVSDSDAVVIEEQGRDTVAILTRARVIPPVGPTTYTVRVSASAPFGPRTGTLTVTQVNGVALNGGAVVEGASGSLEVAVADGDYGTASRFNDYVVSRPAVGAQPGRVTFRVDAPGCTGDSDSVDIEPQRALVPGRIEVISQGPFGTGSWSVGWRAWDASGVLITDPTKVAHAIVQSPPSSAATSITTGTPVWSSANNWWITDLTRLPGYAVRLDLVVDGLTAGGTQRAVLPVTIPTFNEPAPGASDAFSSVVLTANTGANRFELTYTLAPALAGAAVDVSLELVYNDTAPEVIGVAGSRGVVTMPWTPDVFTLVPFSGSTTTYLARVVLTATIAGAVAGISYAGTPFYVDNTGT